MQLSWICTKMYSFKCFYQERGKPKNYTSDIHIKRLTDANKQPKENKKKLNNKHKRKT